MRYIISLALLLMLAWAVNISVEPTYARIPVNSSLSFTISITEGEGKLYRVEVFGPYVSWTSQNVWIGPQGKKLTVDFEPESPGQYSISMKVDSVSATATVDVFQPQTREDLRERIEELRKRVKIFGTIVGIEPANGKIVVDDSTGVVDVFFNTLEVIEKLENYRVGDNVMVIGWATESGIDGEILRRVKGFEPNRYKNVLEVWENVRSKIEQSAGGG